MKQKLLCSIISCAVLLGNVCEGQTVKQQPNSPYKFYVDPAIISSSSFVQSTQPGAAPASPQAMLGDRIMWLEYGDGGFTTNNNTIRPLSTAQPDSWFFISSKLYDGTRDQFRISSGSPFLNRSGRSNPSDNDAPILTGAKQVLITPNAYDIISKDTMSFAVTYKFLPAAGKCYYVIFNYNNNVFLPMAGGADPATTNMVVNNFSSYPIKYARVFHGEISVNPNSIPNFTSFMAQQIGGSYTNSVVMKVCSDVDAPMLAERNIFFSLVSKDALVVGNNTSINATLVQTNNSGANPVVIDQHTIAGMGVALSHDPNYIVQSPVCLQLPKAPRLFQYHLHFQNTGPGEADIAEITLQFTPGFNLNTFNITQGRFSDVNYYDNIHNGISVRTNQALNQVILTMDLQGNRGLNNPLAGTNNTTNPWVNPETMGDVYFNMMSTAAVPYFITAQASIKFHSQHARPLDWETPVTTNTAISNYSTCCDCSLFNCGNTKDSTNKIKKTIPIPKNK